MRRTVVVGFACLGVAVSVGFAACKLELDESLIDSDAAVGNGGSGGAGLGGSGGFGGGSGGKEAGPACDANAECKSDGGCLEGLCVTGNCTYEICPAPSACEGRTCNVSTQTCGAATQLEFEANTIPLPSLGIGCGGNPRLCLAAFEDYAFVGTDDGGLHAWRITDPTNPVKLTIEAPIFSITRMVASEGRLLLLSAPQAGKLQLAWVDLPNDPLAQTLTISSAGVNLATGIASAFPATYGGFLLVDASPYSTALVEPPVANNSTLSTSDTPLSNGNLVAATHTSLLGVFVDSSVIPFPTSLTSYDEAGSSTVSAGATKVMAFEAPVSLAAHQFTSTRDGSVLWTTNRVDRDEAGTATTSALVLRWLFAENATTIPDSPPEVEIATYSSADPDTVRAGPAALIDSTNALTTMTNPSDSASTLVRAVKRANETLTLHSGSVILPFEPTAIGVAATRKFGLVLTPTVTFPAQDVTIHIFAPSCG
jgi:hypothetical protein